MRSLCTRHSSLFGVSRPQLGFEYRGGAPARELRLTRCQQYWSLVGRSLIGGPSPPVNGFSDFFSKIFRTASQKMTSKTARRQHSCTSAVDRPNLKNFEVFDAELGNSSKNDLQKPLLSCKPAHRPPPKALSTPGRSPFHGRERLPPSRLFIHRRTRNPTPARRWRERTWPRLGKNSGFGESRLGGSLALPFGLPSGLRSARALGRIPSLTSRSLRFLLFGTACVTTNRHRPLAGRETRTHRPRSKTKKPQISLRLMEVTRWLERSTEPAIDPGISKAGR